LDLIDLFPISTRAHTPTELALAKAGIESLRPVRVFECPTCLVEAIIDGEGLGDAHSAFEDALKACSIYKQWQKSMPYLKDVLQLSAYRYKKKHHNDACAINRELLSVGRYLQSGQILYRGGIFTSERIIISDGPISTSMHPSVARWHAIEVSGQIAILRIPKNKSVLAYPYKTSGNQRLKHEYEVLLQNNLRLEETSMHSHNGTEIRSYDVYPQNA